MPITTQPAPDPLAEKIKKAIADEAAAAKIIRETEEAHSEIAYKLHADDTKKPWGDCQKQAATEMIQQGDKLKDFPPAARGFLLRFVPDFESATEGEKDPIPAIEQAVEAKDGTADTDEHSLQS